MARWDEILSLPIQSPPTLEFCASDLVWSKVEGWGDKIDRVARIPFARVDEFVRGESSNEHCPTRFHVEARRSHDATSKGKVDAVLEYILYWCSFGPDDLRKGGIIRPSRNFYVSKKKSAGRPNIKRGCTCRFIVKRLFADPSAALIIYNQDKHVDKSGLPCHGPQDKKADGTRAMYAPHFSEDLRLRVNSLLYVGVSVETIMQRHKESVEKQGGPCKRDDFLDQRYLRRQEIFIRRSKYELDADDTVSLSMWADNHPTCVFFYEDFSESDPFTIGIQTEWQLQQMIRFGNRSLLASDSRFGTNKFKCPVHSLLVFNSENKAIPVAWVISPRFSSRDAYKWMRALHNRVLTKDPAWKLAGFIVDDPSSDIKAIRDVFECSVLISLWRIRHAWHKNLMKRCSQNEMRIQMSERLGQVMLEICNGRGNVALFDDFMQDFLNSSQFVEYFKAVWYPRIGFWVTSLQSLPFSSQETSAAVEFYHRQMNVRLLNEEDPNVYQRVDWLGNKLATEVHSYFWLDEYPGKHDFSRYWKDEWLSGLTPWRSSLNIPDSDVTFEGQCAMVADQQDQDKFHVVLNPGSEFSICDCTLSERGNLCEHVCKVTSVCRRTESSKPSLSLYQYKQILLKMLHCTQHDSLIRDHAVSLTAFLQTQLNALADLHSDERMLDEIDQHGGSAGFVTKNTMYIEHQGQNGNLRGAEERLCDESSFHDEMEVDPSSICVSPSGLFAMHGVLPADILSVNGEKRLLRDSYNMNGNDTSKDHEISGSHNPDGMTEEPRSIDMPLSLDTHDPCSVLNQHGDDYTGNATGSVNSNALIIIDLQLDKRSVISTTVGPHPAKKLKITCEVDSKTDDGEAVESHCSSVNICLGGENGGSSDVFDGKFTGGQCNETLTSSETLESEIDSVPPGTKENGVVRSR